MITPDVYVQTIISRILTFIIWPVFVGISVVMFIYAGFLFLSAQGDPTKITKARMAVLWGIIGIIVGILAYSAVGLIKFILNV